MVEKFAPGGATATFAVGSTGSGPGQFDQPQSVAAGPNGDTYVADTANNRIVELDGGGNFVRSWGTRGGANGRFRNPDGIAVDSAGNVYVSDRENDRIQEFTPSGGFITAWGAYGAQPGQLIDPTGIAVDCRGDVIVADTMNDRLQVFAGVAPAVACAAPLTLTPPPTPAPVLRVSLVRRNGVLARRGLTISARCDRACRITPHIGVSVPPKNVAATGMTLASRTLPAQATRLIRFNLRPRGLRLLRRGLGHRHRMLRVYISVVATTVVPSGTPPSTTTSFVRTYRVTP
jgi:hypothetical protein